MARNQNEMVAVEQEAQVSEMPVEETMAEKFSAMDLTGATLADVFHVAHNAFGIGHQTNYCVPHTYMYRVGDPMTEQQARTLSEIEFRNSLENKPYPNVEAAAGVPLKELPVKYSLLEDAIDEIVKGELSAKGVLPGARSERVPHVQMYLGAKRGAKLMSDGSLARLAIQSEIQRVINLPKKVKGSADATTNGKTPPVADGALLIDSDDDE